MAMFSEALALSQRALKEDRRTGALAGRSRAWLDHRR